MASETVSPEQIADEQARVREIAGGPPAAKRRWYRRPLQVLGIVVAVMVAIAGIEQLAYSNRILPGVRVAGTNVAQKTKSAARDAIGDQAAHLEQDPIVASVAGRRLSTTPAAIALHVDAAATYDAARDAGRKDQNAGQLLLGPYQRVVAGKDVPWHVTFDDAKVRAVLANWERTNIMGHVPGDVTFEGTKVVAHDPVVGKTVDAKAAYAPFVAALRKGTRAPIELPTKPVTSVLSTADVERVAQQATLVLREPYDVVWNNTRMRITPDQMATALATTRKPDGTGLALVIEPAKLAATMGKNADGFQVAPVDARFVVNGNNTVSIVGSKDGLQLNYPLLAAPILAGQRTITASFAPLHPAHDTKWAQALGIKEMVSTFTTNHPCCQSRVTNIHLGADIIQNTVVEPGQTFSLNNAMGQRTAARGFVEAPVYYQGHATDIGGGVSQLSTTVFNAAWWGGFKIVEHKPHSIWITRYPPGREATLNWGSVDNRFENDSKHGILVHTSYTGTSITVSIYGDREGKVVREENRKVTSGVQAASAPFTVEFDRVIDQPGMPERREHYRWHYVAAQP